jgi:hypothetical protein
LRRFEVRHRPEADGCGTGIKDDLPPITTFLNRLLALTIELQGILFTAFEQLADRADRGRHRIRHLRRRVGNADGRELVVTDRGRSTPIRAPAPRPGCSPSRSASAIGR